MENRQHNAAENGHVSGKPQRGKGRHKPHQRSLPRPHAQPKQQERRRQRKQRVGQLT
jgi:hypothetical protein